MEPVLFAVSAEPLQDPVLFDAAYRSASEVRREKADRCRMEKDKRLSISAGLLLQYGSRMIGVSESKLCYTEKGQPFLSDSSVSVSLSHSGSYAICALADCAVGCDIEKKEPVRLEIAKRFFCPEEYADIVSAPDEQAQTDLFYRYWTWKESFMKATGLGMKLPLNAFRLLRGDPITVLQSVDGNTYHFAEFDTLTGYACSLCTAGECRSTKLRLLQWTDLLP